MYKRPSYNIKTTGVFTFKTKDKDYLLKSYNFERESDTEDSLEIQDELRSEIGSIRIKNSAWNKLAKGETIIAKTSKARGDIAGRLTRIDDINNSDKYEKGGGLEPKQDKVAKVMHEWKAGTLTSNGKVVTDYDQAVAIALSEAGLSKKMEEGAYIEQENALMVANNNKQIAHHTEEMEQALKDTDYVPAWVVAKVNRSASDLSDATHYLEGQEGKYAEGGGIEDADDFIENVKEMHESIDYVVLKDGTKIEGEKLMNKGGDMNKYAKGGAVDAPKIYVADLEAYNNGKLVGEWLDLSDFEDGKEVSKEISKLLKKWGAEEYAIHDVENVPSSIYSEYMGEEDFDKIIKIYKASEENDLPYEVISEIMLQYEPEDLEEWISDHYEGHFDNDTDLAYSVVESIGSVSDLGKKTTEMYFDYEGFGRDLEINDEWEGDFDSDEDRGYDYVENMGGVSELGDKTIDMYFDYEKFGRDLAINDYTEIEDGYYFRTPRYAKGGLTNERRYVNKSQDYETRYAKDRLKRTGYKSERKFAVGGELRSFNDRIFGKIIIFKEEQIGKFTIGIKSGFNNNRHVFIYEGKKGSYGSEGLPKNFKMTPQISIADANRFYSELKIKAKNNQDLEPFQIIKEKFAVGGGIAEMDENAHLGYTLYHSYETFEEAKKIVDKWRKDAPNYNAIITKDELDEKRPYNVLLTTGVGMGKRVYAVGGEIGNTVSFKGDYGTPRSGVIKEKRGSSYIVGTDDGDRLVDSYEVIGFSETPVAKKKRFGFFEGGGEISDLGFAYLADLWFAVQQKDTDDYEKLAKYLDEEGISHRIQNEVSADASELRGRKSLSISEVHDRIKKILAKKYAGGGEIENKIEKLKKVVSSKMLPESVKAKAQAEIDKLEKQLHESKETKSEEKEEHEVGGYEARLDDKEELNATIQKLYDIEAKAEDLINYQSGGIQGQSVDKIKKYVEYVNKEVSKLNVPFGSDVFDVLEDENAHSLNLTLGLLGFYKNEKDSGEWAKKHEQYAKVVEVVNEVKGGGKPEDKEPTTKKPTTRKAPVKKAVAKKVVVKKEIKTPSKEIVDYFKSHGKKEAYLYNNRIGFNKGMQSKEQYNVNHDWISKQDETPAKLKTDHKKLLAKIKAKKTVTPSNAPSKGHKRSESSDKKREALPLGKRISKNGVTYYENRLNRADISKEDKFEGGGEIGKNSSGWGLKFLNW